MKRTILAALVLVVGAAPLFAQDILARGLDLERQGRLEEAADAFRVLLSRDPVNAAALLGIERVYDRLGRRDSTLALVRRALASNSQNLTARQVELRTSYALGGEALAVEALERWVAVAPRSEAPYAEWVRILLQERRLEQARAVVAGGRERLGDSTRLGPQAAQVEGASGSWLGAAREWRGVVLRQPGYLGPATFALEPVPVNERERVLRLLAEGDSAHPGRRLAAELLLAWNEPARAWALIRTALPRNAEERRTALRHFSDRALARETPEAQRAGGEALEALAAGAPPPEGARLRVESARAFAAAGDVVAARRVLLQMAQDASAPPGAAASAVAALVDMAARAGDAAEAQRVLEGGRARLPGSEALRVSRVVARSWIRSGELSRAEAVIAADSSLAAEEVRGWIALYRGHLSRARELLRASGYLPPEAGGSADRAAAAALLQAVESDSVPALGAALLQAARGDSLGAARALVPIARQVRSGEAELLLVAAGLARSGGDVALAESLWSEIITQHAQAPAAPPALLALARALRDRGLVSQAASRLETLILAYPESALVPEARRELDRIRGLVPRS
jgi:tetratricopeptide (TPR) repeat protein